MNCDLKAPLLNCYVTSVTTSNSFASCPSNMRRETSVHNSASDDEDTSIEKFPVEFADDYLLEATTVDHFYLLLFSYL